MYSKMSNVFTWTPSLQLSCHMTVNSFEPSRYRPIKDYWSFVPSQVVFISKKSISLVVIISHHRWHSRWLVKIDKKLLSLSIRGFCDSPVRRHYDTPQARIGSYWHKDMIKSFFRSIPRNHIEVINQGEGCTRFELELISTTLTESICQITVTLLPILCIFPLPWLSHFTSFCPGICVVTFYISHSVICSQWIEFAQKSIDGGIRMDREIPSTHCSLCSI